MVRSKLVGLTTLLVGVLGPGVASADPWGKVIDHLAEGATVEHRDEGRLVLRAPGVARSLVMADAAGPGVDLWLESVVRRGQNPYRAWYVRRQLAEELPKPDWPRFLRVSFLRLLRLKPAAPG